MTSRASFTLTCPLRLAKQGGRVEPRKGFTLIELLVVIAILGTIAVAVVLVINPAELIKQARDSTRLEDLGTINRILGLFQADQVDAFMGTSSIVYVSVPDTSATCVNLGLPTLPSGWSYACAPTSTLQKADGTGWIPVNLTAFSAGSPLSKFPVDPVNATSTGEYYAYVTGSSWELTAFLKSDKYKMGGGSDKASKDSGQHPELYELGSTLKLTPVTRDPSLVGYWKLDETSGTLYDTSGHGNNGTQSGGVTYGATGKVGNALSFDGVDDYVSTILSPPSTVPVSVLLWIYPTDNTVSHCVVSRPPAGWFPLYGVCPYLSTNEVYNYTNGLYGLYLQTTESYGAAMRVTSNVSPPNNTWSQVGFTYDGSSFTLFYNGQATGKTLWCKTGGCNENQNYLSISGSQTHSLGKANDAWKSNLFQGSIDDIRIYNRALSAAEISAIYSATQ
ncbi:MAG: LamG-like jellyroll fold domain-containing protein [Candidatus Jorgensenbacteria bacterium]